MDNSILATAINVCAQGVDTALRAVRAQTIVNKKQRIINILMLVVGCDVIMGVGSLIKKTNRLEKEIEELKKVKGE